MREVWNVWSGWVYKFTRLSVSLSSISPWTIIASCFDRHIWGNFISSLKRSEQRKNYYIILFFCWFLPFVFQYFLTQTRLYSRAVSWPVDGGAAPTINCEKFSGDEQWQLVLTLKQVVHRVLKSCECRNVLIQQDWIRPSIQCNEDCEEVTSYRLRLSIHPERNELLWNILSYKNLKTYTVEIKINTWTLDFQRLQLLYLCSVSCVLPVLLGGQANEIKLEINRWMWHCLAKRCSFYINCTRSNTPRRTLLCLNTQLFFFLQTGRKLQ